jgi:hypothetical protein
VILKRGLCLLGVTDVCETELACGDVEGWRFGMDVGGQKGVVFICSLGGFVGQGVGTGFGLGEEYTAVGLGVCSDWVCREGAAGGQSRRFR